MNERRSRLITLCLSSLEAKGFGKDERYRSRLKKEIKEIDAQDEHDYLLNLYDEFKEKKLIFPKNEHNLLVDWLLGLASDFDIEKGYDYVQGEMPDIDIDYLRPVRDYLKREWATKTFGQEYVCEIGNYGTLGIKSSILDMCRVHGYDFHELQSITKEIKDKYQDEDGVTRDLEWDKALEIYPKFKDYCERHPEVAEAARLLLNRNKSGGVHAGGLVISSVPIDGFVPLEVRGVKKEIPDGIICSAWAEGLSTQDLQPVGLVKFDLLVINNLMQIALAMKFVKERHRIEHICALPDQWDWSDISYLNDPKIIDMANRGDLKCIFQFDGDGIRKLVKRGGVTGFDDLAAYSAIYRPGCIQVGMDVSYCRRKNGEEPYNIHPLLQQSLGKTYGIMVYQEQVIDVLRIVGKIPSQLTEKIRKAISKKKLEQFVKYKEMFIENGQKTLGVNREFVENLFKLVESYSGYGFNKSMTIGTLIETTTCVKEIQDIQPGERVYCVDESGETVETDVVALHDHGELEAFEVTFDDGYQVTCSADHKFLTEKGQISLREILRTRYSILCDRKRSRIHAVESNIVSLECNSDECVIFPQLCLVNENAGHVPITDTGNLVSRQIVRVVSVGKRQMFDLEVANRTHNFILPNGVVTSNSHAYAYSTISARLLWLKAHYPLEFYTAVLMCKEDTDKFREYKLDAKSHGIDVCPVHINKSKENFAIGDDNKIYFGFSNIKGIGDGVAKKIVEGQPYKNFQDFLERCSVPTPVVKRLIALGVFEERHSRLRLWKYAEFFKDKYTKRCQRAQRHQAKIKERHEELRQLLLTEITENDPDFSIMCQFSDEAAQKWKERFSSVAREVSTKSRKNKIIQVSLDEVLMGVWTKMQKSIADFEAKEKEDDEHPVTIEQFPANLVKVVESDVALFTDELVLNGHTTYPMAENEFYGFLWTHVLEASPDYHGFTIAKLLEENENNPNFTCGPIEVRINHVLRRTSKNGTVFYSVEVQDADGTSMKINVWQNDYNRYEEELKAGNLIRITVNPPGGGFNTLTMKSHPRNKMPPKEEDVRLLLLRKPEVVKPIKPDSAQEMLVIENDLDDN